MQMACLMASLLAVPDATSLVNSSLICAFISFSAADMALGAPGGTTFDTRGAFDASGACAAVGESGFARDLSKATTTEPWLSPACRWGIHTLHVEGLRGASIHCMWRGFLMQGLLVLLKHAAVVHQHRAESPEAKGPQPGPQGGHGIPAQG